MTPARPLARPVPARLRAPVFALATLLAASAAAPAFAGSSSERVAPMQPDTTGSQPGSALVRGVDGAFYGTASGGGAYGHGTVYRVDGQGAISVVHAFDADEAETITAGLAAAPDGWLYGATTWGAAHGLGGVYRVAPDGRFEMLHAFDDGPDHGARNPGAAPTLAPDGTLFGTTVYSDGYPEHDGTVWRLDPDGTFRVIWLFGSALSAPYAGVSLGHDGQLYGLAASDAHTDCGAIYALAPDGTNFRVVHRFDADVDGCQPRATMLVEPAGTMVGTTRYGGPVGGIGAVFRFDPATGAVQVLHVFHDDDPLGSTPVGGVSRDAGGVLYGTTQSGAALFHGALYAITRDGATHLLHAFAADGTDGGDATCPPTPAGSGTLVGPSPDGGSAGAGVVYGFRGQP
jgi:uncharacterized repeat protein (TIGR03803 family)